MHQREETAGLLCALADFKGRELRLAPVTRLRTVRKEDTCAEDQDVSARACIHRAITSCDLFDAFTSMHTSLSLSRRMAEPVAAGIECVSLSEQWNRWLPQRRCILMTVTMLALFPRLQPGLPRHVPWPEDLPVAFGRSRQAVPQCTYKGALGIARAQPTCVASCVCVHPRVVRIAADRGRRGRPSSHVPACRGAVAPVSGAEWWRSDGSCQPGQDAFVDSAPSVGVGQRLLPLPPALVYQTHLGGCQSRLFVPSEPLDAKKRPDCWPPYRTLSNTMPRLDQFHHTNSARRCSPSRGRPSILKQTRPVSFLMDRGASSRLSDWSCCTCMYVCHYLVTAIRPCSDSIWGRKGGE